MEVIHKATVGYYLAYVQLFSISRERRKTFSTAFTAPHVIFNAFQSQNVRECRDTEKSKKDRIKKV